MDLVCISCMEPWEFDFVLHEEPKAFERTGGVITKCPACKGEKNNGPLAQEIAALGAMMGDDIDGFAAMLEDMRVL